MTKKKIDLLLISRWIINQKARNNNNKKSPTPDSFTGKSHQTFKTGLIPILLKFFLNWRGGTLPNSFWKANIALIPKPDKGTTGKLQTNVLYDHWWNNPQQNTCQMKSASYGEKWYNMTNGFMPGMQKWIDIWKLVNEIHHTDNMKGKVYTIISVDAGKASDKSQHTFTIKTRNQLEIERSHFFMRKAMCGKPIAL